MGQGGAFLSNDKKVPPGGAFLPSYPPSLGGKNVTIKSKEETRDSIVFLLALAQVALLM